MESEKKRINVTLSIDREVQRDFKIENIKNSSDMSTTVENFMRNYIKVSQELHAERIAKNTENGR